MLEHTRFATADTDVAHEYLCEVYAEHRPTLSGDPGGFRFQASSVAESRFSVEFIKHSMGLRTVVAPYGDLLVAHVTRGRVGMTGGSGEIRAGAGEEFLIPPDERLAVTWDELELGIVRLDTGAVTAFAAESLDGAPRFPLSRPVSAARARYWRSTVRHVTRDFLSDPAASDSPLLRTEVFRLLAASLLEAFPITGELPKPTGAVESAALRRATAFIEANAHRDITVTEIADAARVGPRALQNAFRRALDTTPIAYLREVRLEGAHLALLAADPTAGATVATIASAWGFLHHGRFAAAYRTRYGHSPRQTLNT